MPASLSLRDLVSESERERPLSQRPALKTTGHSHLPTCPSSKEYVSEDPKRQHFSLKNALLKCPTLVVSELVFVLDVAE